MKITMSQLVEALYKLGLQHVIVGEDAQGFIVIHTDLKVKSGDELEELVSALHPDQQ